LSPKFIPDKLKNINHPKRIKTSVSLIFSAVIITPENKKTGSTKSVRREKKTA